MKKKGFTLIELLAVIVILAIIALIATPIVMNVIENARKSAAERSAENYLRAVDLAIASDRLDGPVTDGEYKIQEDGSLCIVENGIVDCSKSKLNVEVNGDKPSTESKIKISNGLVNKTNTILIISGYPLTYNADAKVFEAGYLCEKTGKASKTLGAEYTCHLDTDRTFYVLENNESSENISLIMDRNFTDGTVPTTLAWCRDGVIDNKTCKNINSKEEGTPLKYIQDTFGNKVEVSFPTKSQITNAYEEKMPQWLYDYLDGAANLYGYWTASPNDDDTSIAWYVVYNGSVYGGHVGISYAYGVRPVITISKSLID